ncbi:outer membrane beta-barrel protein [Porphyromonas endodontalis]|jgi:hypothetical protein|uniref:outer membrane beta-barrel protein n=1 Tax=Porphyromonas endodontalis TaxID=28124 RepID=UPI003613E6DD
MKQILLTAVILAMGIAPAFGQKHVQNEKKHSVTHNERHFSTKSRRNRPTRVHLYAGLGTSNVKLLTQGLRVESESNLLSPTVGINVRIPINDVALFLTPGLSYNQRGMRFVFQTPGVGVTTVRTPIHTLSGNLLLGTGLGSNDFRLRFSCGFYAGYAIAGSAIMKVSKEGGNVEVYETDLFNGDKSLPSGGISFDGFNNGKVLPALKRFDLGTRVSWDFEFGNHYNLSFTFDHSILNQSNNETVKLYHRSAFTTIGYTF